MAITYVLTCVLSVCDNVDIFSRSPVGVLLVCLNVGEHGRGVGVEVFSGRIHQIGDIERFAAEILIHPFNERNRFKSSTTHCKVPSFMISSKASSEYISKGLLYCLVPILGLPTVVNPVELLTPLPSSMDLIQ